MKFAITGSSGFLGSALRGHLLDRGHEVTRVVRSFAGVPPGEKVVVWHPEQGTIEAASLEGHDGVIHLAGENLFGVWTESRKRRIRESRVQGTTLLARTLAGLEHKPRVLLSASAVGVYGVQPAEKTLTEDSEPGSGFLADVVREWEAATEPAAEAGIRVVRMRNGNVLHPSGGMLQVMVPLFRLGLGGKLGSGEQAFGWIALEDVPPAMLHVVEHGELAGPVNFVAPDPVTNEEFTRALAAVLGRPALFRLPAFAAKLAPGGMGEEMLLASGRAVPERLLASGYAFRCPDLKGALKAMLG